MIPIIRNSKSTRRLGAAVPPPEDCSNEFNFSLPRSGDKYQSSIETTATTLVPCSSKRRAKTVAPEHLLKLATLPANHCRKWNLLLPSPDRNQCLACRRNCCWCLYILPQLTAFTTGQQLRMTVCPHPWNRAWAELWDKWIHSFSSLTHLFLVMCNGGCFSFRKWEMSNASRIAVSFSIFYPMGS